MTTLTVEDRALRMLAAGDSLTDVSVATGLTKDEVAKLKRDFPGTRTQQPPSPQVPMRIGTATPIQGVPSPALSRAITDASPPPLALVGGAPAAASIASTFHNDQAYIRRFLQQFPAHPDVKVRAAADKARAALEQLLTIASDYEQNEKARREAEQDNSAALAEIADLEEKLNAARARLTSATTAKPRKGWSPERRAAAAEQRRRLNTPVPCDGCGRTFGHAGALGNHRRSCTGTPSSTPEAATDA